MGTKVKKVIVAMMTLGQLRDFHLWVSYKDFYVRVINFYVRPTTSDFLLKSKIFTYPL